MKPSALFFTRKPEPLYLYYAYDKEAAMLAIRLPEDIERRLGALAAATGRTKTFYARKAIEEALDEMEDIYLAENRLEALKAGRSRRYTLEEVEKDLGLAH